MILIITNKKTVNAYLKGDFMIKKSYKQIFAFSICALLMPQVLYGHTQVVNDIELKVNDCADNPGEVLVYGGTSITVAQFLQKGIHPVKLKISNKSNESMIISPKSVFKEASRC